MARADLFERTMAGWARLNPQQRERFFRAGLRTALRLERQEFREWLIRRVGEPPLAEPVDPASFAISQADIALLMRSARKRHSNKTRSATRKTKNANIFECRGRAVPPFFDILKGPQKEISLRGPQTCRCGDCRRGLRGPHRRASIIVTSRTDGIMSCCH
jgi:hypothetical protein